MKTASSFLLTLFILASSACSGGLVRGEPPLVGVSGLELEGQTIRTQVDIYNPNGVEMPVETVDLSMKLAETDLGSSTQRPSLTIHPNGTEGIRFEFPSREHAARMLVQLEGGEIASLAYSVKGKISNSAGDSEKFSQDGYFYPVPGRPGQFRGAGPQRARPTERPIEPPGERR